MKDNKFLNFMGDDGNYIFNPPMPNPYGLRGNPDNNANCQNNDCYEGDGLNGTPAYFDSNDRVYDYPPADFNSFDGSQWSNDGTETTGWNNANGWFSNLFDKDGMSTYYTCDNGFPISQRFETGQQPSGWGRNRNNACLSQSQIDDKRQNTTDTITGALKGLLDGYKTGLGTTTPTDNSGGLVFDPANNPTPTQTTTTTQAGIGTTGKVIGWVLISGVILSIGYMAFKSK